MVRFGFGYEEFKKKTDNAPLALTGNPKRLTSSANPLIVSPMGELFGFIWCAIAGLFQSRAALQAKILALRYQLNILHRRSSKRIALRRIDRLVFCGLCRLSPTVLDELKILQPETVNSCHHAGFQAYWRWRSRRRSGRRRIPAGIRHLILEMSVANQSLLKIVKHRKNLEISSSHR